MFSLFMHLMINLRNNFPQINFHTPQVLIWDSCSSDLSLFFVEYFRLFLQYRHPWQMNAKYQMRNGQIYIQRWFIMQVLDFCLRITCEYNYSLKGAYTFYNKIYLSGHTMWAFSNGSKGPTKPCHTKLSTSTLFTIGWRGLRGVLRNHGHQHYGWIFRHPVQECVRSSSWCWIQIQYAVT